MTQTEPKGLTGEDMDVEQAKQRVIEFFGRDKVKAVDEVGRVDEGQIKTYSYSV